MVTTRCHRCDTLDEMRVECPRKIFLRKCLSMTSEREPKKKFLRETLLEWWNPVTFWFHIAVGAAALGGCFAGVGQIRIWLMVAIALPLSRVFVDAPWRRRQVGNAKRLWSDLSSHPLPVGERVVEAEGRSGVRGLM